MRIYDDRLGRFLSVDPLTSKYPMLTPYQFASNRSIDGIDMDGLEWTKSKPYFSGPTGKYVVDYKIILSIPSSSNWHVSNRPSQLNDIGKIAGEILSNSNASGTAGDPLINTKITFKNDDAGTFKFSVVTATVSSNLINGQQDPVITTRLSDGKLYDGKVTANGITDEFGDVTNNQIRLVTYTGLRLLKNGKDMIGKTVDLSDPTSNSVQKFARTVAHELGHAAGLLHPFSTKVDENDISNTDALGPVGNPGMVKKNLMNSEGNIDWLRSNNGIELSKKQREKIDQKVKE